MKKMISAIMILILLGMPSALLAQDITSLPEWSGSDDPINMLEMWTTNSSNNYT